MGKTRNSLFSLRRAFAVAADSAKVSKSPAKMMKNMADTGKETTKEINGKETIFWMRDPKTGNWIPENHFGDVDVAELREKLLSKNP